MKRGNLIAAATLLISVGIIGWWIYHNFERVENREWYGYRGEAKNNPLLAAEYFLRRMGLEARSIDGPDALSRLPENGTLLIATERFTLGEQRSNALLEWVERGGHLILHPRRPIPGVDPDPDPLLDPLGVWNETPSRSPESGSEDETETGEPEESPTGDETADEESSDIGTCSTPADYLPLPGREDPLEIEFTTLWTLSTGELETSWSYHDEWGYRILQHPRGLGQITVFSEMAFLNNDNIDEYDHAQLLYWLTGARPGPVWLLHTDDMPPLWLWLWHHATTAVVAAGLLLILWLWKAPWRFGPLLPPVSTRRRRIMEHIDAGGHYLWKHGQGTLLLEGVRDALHARLHRVRPDLAALPPERLVLRLAEITGIGIGQIKQALMGNAPSNRDAFTRQIQILETIRKQL